MNPARYLVLTPGATSADGIAELSRLVVRALACTVADPAHGRVDVVSMADPPGFGLRDHVAGARCFGAGGAKSRFIAAALRAGLEGAGVPDVVCLHLHLSPIARLVGAGRARLVTLLAGIEAWKPLRRAERGALRRSDLLVAISAHTARRFREVHPEFGDRVVRVCHPGVRDRDGAAAALAPDGDGARSTGAPFALIVGRMAAGERYKGHDQLIDLWPGVVAEVPGATLVVAGDGDDRARLEARASRVERVRFLGRVSDVTLADLYRDCAFFVMPSRDEGFGLVFLEAMRAGKACIGGAGAAAELIDDGVTGLVVDPGAAGQVLGAMVRLFREPGTRERMGRAGAARVAREFTETHFRSRFRALLGRVAGVA